MVQETGVTAPPPGALSDPFGLVGTLLDGHYRVDEVVGEGGFGVVYRGRHLSLDQPIAIKVLKGLDGEDPSVNALVLEKFRSEARLLYTLSQSSLRIVRALDFGAISTPSGIWAPYMILEWLEGRSLDDDLDERRARGMRGRSLAEALAILEPVAEGLAVAHREHVAHRDVKPANVFLVAPRGTDPKSQVKVLDFGVAKIMKEGESAGTKGTFASFTWLYAAPEQLDPRVGPTGPRTDVYGFALLLTELLTDRPPIDEHDVVAIMKAATNPARRPTPRTRGANIPDEIEAACLRALAVDPRERFGSISEFWTVLATVRRSGVTTVRPPPDPMALPRGTPVPGTVPPMTTPALGMPPPPGVYAAPALQQQRFTPPPMQPYNGGPLGPPRGTAPPPGRATVKIARADGTSPVVVLAVIAFVIALLLAGCGALVFGVRQFH
jgi:serine/threonine protein kinase